MGLSHPDHRIMFTSPDVDSKGDDAVNLCNTSILHVFLVFIVLLFAYLSAMVYEGVYNISSYKETGQLRPFSGRDAGGF